MRELIELELPIYWASYLVNGDDSGLREGEKEEIDAFIAKEKVMVLTIKEGSEGFSWSNDANSLGGDTATYICELIEG